MLDSELVRVRGEVAARPVVPEAGGRGEQSQADAGAEAGEGAGAVALEPELAFAGPEDRFDPLAVPSPEALSTTMICLGDGSAFRADRQRASSSHARHVGITTSAVTGRS
jgi:hypothetical protein